VSARRDTLLQAAVVCAALFAFYLPSSVDGVISRPLSVVSMAGTATLLLGMILVSGRVAPPPNVAAALAMGLVLAVFTITSPFEATSPGVAMLYLAQGLLFMLDLRGCNSPRIDRMFQAITLVSLVLGYALVLNVGLADGLMVRWYAAFYPELLGNMVILFNKPVLTFATHSMAGFMIYLFFYMHFRAWRLVGGWWRLAAAAGFLGLLVALTSTTGMAFAAVACAQVAWAGRASLPRQRALAAVTLSILVFAAATAAGVDINTVLARAEAAIVGDRVRGLFARYAVDGLLASNMKYLSESPLRPIGIGATDTLYLGDSGLIVNLLRGSVPLLIAVYGGLWLFLRTNLVNIRSAAWLWLAVVLFEIGFTPLQYFRFLGFVPFAVMYLNHIERRAQQGVTQLGAKAATR